jgi:hypothetical protein
LPKPARQVEAIWLQLAGFASSKKKLIWHPQFCCGTVIFGCSRIVRCTRLAVQLVDPARCQRLGIPLGEATDWDK